MFAGKNHNDLFYISEFIWPQMTDATTCIFWNYLNTVHRVLQLLPHYPQFLISSEEMWNCSPCLKVWKTVHLVYKYGGTLYLFISVEEQSTMFIRVEEKSTMFIRVEEQSTMFNKCGRRDHFAYNWISPSFFLCGCTQCWFIKHAVKRGRYVRKKSQIRYGIKYCF